MFETKAVFKRKENEIEATDCVVDKVIRLSGAEYDIFSRNLMRDWGFIRDNPVDIVVDPQGRHHCLLVLGEGCSDGILVNAEGGSYARYSAFVPGAAALDIADRYPCLAERTRQLVDAADYIVSLTADKPPHFTVGLHDLYEKFGVSFAPYDSITDMFLLMLSDRPEIEDVRCGAAEFFIDTAPVPERAPEIVPAAAEDNEMFYRRDGHDLCVGYLRGDFGRHGDEFRHNWFGQDDSRNTPAFKAEFQNVMDTLRLDTLKDYKSSTDFCCRHPEAVLPDGDGYRYGFKLETENRQYFVRCTTLRDDYFYIFVYDKAVTQERDLDTTPVNREDMIAYGYTRGGMEPMNQDQALNLRDADKEVYLLYPDGTEAAADSREDIISFDGLFGREVHPLENEKPQEKPSVLEQIRKAKKVPPAPRKQKDGRGKDGPEL